MGLLARTHYPEGNRMSYDDDGPSEPRRATTTGTATSRLGQGRAAARRATRARLALSGASGSGKTWTALSVAMVLAGDGPVLMIDTEPADGRNTAGELYADQFRFDVIQWEPPYATPDLALTIREAGDHLVPGSKWAGRDGGYAVIMVDSASHFWRGQGGTLDVAGGRYGGWKEATPMQDALVDTILRSPAHVLVCTRAKQDYQLEQGTDGKQKVTKLGMAPIQRDDLEYEFQVVVTLDESHQLEVGKTRAAPLAGMRYRANEQAQFAQQYAAWLASGEPELARQADADLLAAGFDAITDAQVRGAAKQAFVGVFGKPSMIPAERLADARAWVADAVARASAPAGPSDEPTAPPAAGDAETPPEAPGGPEGGAEPGAPAPPAVESPGEVNGARRRRAKAAQVQAEVDAEAAAARAAREADVLALDGASGEG